MKLSNRFTFPTNSYHSALVKTKLFSQLSDLTCELLAQVGSTFHTHHNLRIILNKPGTAKVRGISKARNCKRWDPLGFVKLQLVAKYQKNEGGPFGDL